MAITYHHVTVAGAGDNSGDSWANAMALSDFDTDLASASAGDVYFVKEGSYNLTGDLSTGTNGTAAEPVCIIGVLSGTTHEGQAIDDSDFATGANRPVFDCGGYFIGLSDYGRIHNIIAESSDTYAIKVDSHGIIYNCKAHNDYGSSGAKYGIYTSDSNVRFINCEASSANGNALSSDSQSKVFFCYLHDCTDGTYGIGIRAVGEYITVLFCIFDALRVGYWQDNEHGGVFFGNTFYDCDSGIVEDNAAAGVVALNIINNIFSECDIDDMRSDTVGYMSFLAYNHHHNSVDACEGFPEEGTGDDLFCDWWKTTGDPKFNNPGADFSLQSDSPCIDAGMAMALGVG